MSLIEQAKSNTNNNSPLLLTLLSLLIAVIASIESIQRQDLVWGPLHDSSHSFIFFLASLIGYIIFGLKSQQMGLRVALVGGTCFAIGIAIEVLQPLVGRSASFNDIYYNFIGIVSGALMFIVISRSTMQLSRRALLALTSVFLLASSLTVPAMGYYTYMQRDSLSPTLLNFEQSWQRRLWRAGGGAHAKVVDAPNDWKNDGKTVRIDYPKRSYPGLTIKHVHPDWSGYDWLEFSVYSKLNKPSELTVRVNDRKHIHQYHDRFNQRIVVQPGANTFRIDMNRIKNAPKGREMQLDDIAELAIFTVKPSEEFSLYFDDFGLGRD